MTAKNNSILDSLRLDTRFTKDWDKMAGDNIVRLSIVISVATALLFAYGETATAEEFITNSMVENDDGTLSITDVRCIEKPVYSPDGRVYLTEAEIKIGPTSAEFKKTLRRRAADVPRDFFEAIEAQLKGRNNRAIDYYERAIATNPTYVSSYNNLAVCLVNRNQPGDLALADSILSKAEKLVPNSPSIFLLKASVCDANGDTEGKVKYLTSYLNNLPNNPRVIFELVDIYDKQNERYKAFTLLRSAKWYASSWSADEQARYVALIQSHELTRTAP